MIRSLSLALLIPTILTVSSAVRDPAAVCGGVARAEPLGVREFRAVLDSVAAGWNEARAELAASCFTERAIYVEPPARQLYRGRPDLLRFFAASIHPPRPDRMRWHAIAFDSVRQVGFGEYTYRGGRNYHGVAVVQLDAGLIRSWREYQYGSELPWEEFIGASR
jgi:hypothetical protein